MTMPLARAATPEMRALLLPAPSTRPPLLRLVPPPEAVSAAQAALPLDGVEPSLERSPEVPPDVERSVRYLARALCESLAGRRPAAQVSPLLTPRVAFLVDHLLKARAAAGLSLAGIRIQMPAGGVVEASLRLSGERGSVAIALRLQRRGSAWVVAALEAALGPGARRPARS
ncbi:MAG: Rv3235 family protein [Actinomycetes bacterium]